MCLQVINLNRRTVVGSLMTEVKPATLGARNMRRQKRVNTCSLFTRPELQIFCAGYAHGMAFPLQVNRRTVNYQVNENTRGSNLLVSPWSAYTLLESFPLVAVPLSRAEAAFIKAEKLRISATHRR